MRSYIGTTKSLHENFTIEFQGDKMYKFLLVFFCLCCLCGFSMHLQTWDAACVETKVGCTAWSPIPPAIPPTYLYTLNLREPDCNAEIEYMTRVCGGETQIVITGWTVNWGCGGFDDDVNFHYTKTGLKEYIVQGLLYKLYGETSVPPCSTGATNYVSVYSAACGIWACCEYTLPPTPIFTCEPEWGADAPPHYGTTPKKVKSCKWKSCGTICCERKYSVCQTGAGTPVINIISKAPIGTCTTEAAASPAFSKPCQDGC